MALNPPVPGVTPPVGQGVHIRTYRLPLPLHHSAPQCHLLVIPHRSLLPGLHVRGLVPGGRRGCLQHGALGRRDLRRHQRAAGAERGGEAGLVLLAHACGARDRRLRCRPLHHKSPSGSLGDGGPCLLFRASQTPPGTANMPGCPEQVPFEQGAFVPRWHPHSTSYGRGQTPPCRSYGGLVVLQRLQQSYSKASLCKSVLRQDRAISPHSITFWVSLLVQRVPLEDGVHVEISPEQP